MNGQKVKFDDTQSRVRGARWLVTTDPSVLISPLTISFAEEPGGLLRTDKKRDKEENQTGQKNKNQRNPTKKAKKNNMYAVFI